MEQVTNDARERRRRRMELALRKSEERFRSVAEAALAPLGYEVEVTAQARMFERLFESRLPTAVIIGIVMPETDGIELIRWIAARSTDVRVIIASGSKSENATAAAVLGAAAGIKTIISLRKPLSLAELREAVARQT